MRASALSSIMHMRNALVLAVLVVASTGCRSSAPSTTTTPTTPAHPPVHVDAFARDQIKSGFATPVELVDNDGAVVASCNVTYDVWRDEYLVQRSDYSYALVNTIPKALGTCLGGQPNVELTARVEPTLSGGSQS
jgi:hypothetical protein